MYYYIVSNDNYNDYYPVTVGHDNKFTNKEFTHLFNECNEKDDYEFSADIVSKNLCEKYGFVLVEPIFEINTYDGFDGKIDLDKVDNKIGYYSENETI